MNAVVTETDIDNAEDALVSYMADLRDCPDGSRHTELVAWTRSNLWHCALLLLTGWQGELAREANRALRRDLDAETPGKRWWNLNPGTGRQSIQRLVGVEEDPARFYASAAFRSWPDDDGRTWIAGAVGCPPYLSDRFGKWLYTDIRDVVLWDPRTGEAQLAGEHTSSSMFVMPDDPEPRLTIWGDCGAFFRAWAARRARVGRLGQMRARGEWVHPVVERADGDLPGGLLIGSYLRAQWPSVAARSVLSAEGITPAELHFAATRAAGLPTFGEAQGGRG